MVRAIKQGKLKLGHGAAVIQTILLRLDTQNCLNQSIKSSQWKLNLVTMLLCKKDSPNQSRGREETNQCTTYLLKLDMIVNL